MHVLGRDWRLHRVRSPCRCRLSSSWLPLHVGRDVQVPSAASEVRSNRSPCHRDVTSCAIGSWAESGRLRHGGGNHLIPQALSPLWVFFYYPRPGCGRVYSIRRSRYEPLRQIGWPLYGVARFTSWCGQWPVADTGGG